MKFTHKCISDTAVGQKPFFAQLGPSGVLFCGVNEVRVLSLLFRFSAARNLGHVANMDEMDESHSYPEKYILGTLRVQVYPQ